MERNIHEKLDHVFWMQCPSEMCFNADKATNKGNTHHRAKHTNVPRQFYNALESTVCSAFYIQMCTVLHLIASHSEQRAETKLVAAASMDRLFIHQASALPCICLHFNALVFQFQMSMCWA